MSSHYNSYPQAYDPNSQPPPPYAYPYAYETKTTAPSSLHPYSQSHISQSPSLSSTTSTYSTTSIPYFTPTTELSVYTDSRLTHSLKVLDTQKREAFHVKNSLWTPGTPDLTIHAGQTSGATLGAAKFHSFSRDIDLQIHDGYAAKGPLYERLEAAGTLKSAMRFQFDVPTSQSVERRSFVWKPTSASSEPDAGSRYGNWKLVDEGSGEVVAVFLRTKMSIKKWGKFRFNRDLGGQKWIVMVLLTGLSILEQKRRRQCSSSGDGGAGAAAAASG